MKMKICISLIEFFALWYEGMQYFLECQKIYAQNTWPNKNECSGTWTNQLILGLDAFYYIRDDFLLDH